MYTNPVFYALFSLLISPLFCTAQLVGTDAFLQGEFIQMGINQCGVYASSDSISSLMGPEGPYYPTEIWLGYIADVEMDGWTTGTGANTYCGDYFVPGEPVEGWAIQIGTGTVFRNTDQPCTNFLNPGSVTSYVDGTSYRQATWEGNHYPLTGDSLYIIQETTVPATSLYFMTEVTLCNLSADTIFDLYWMRNVDPDNEQPWTGDFVTTNTIESQFPTDTTAVVTAVSVGIGCPFAYVSVDPRSRVTHGGFYTGSPYDAWNGLSPYNLSGTVTADYAIQVTFKIDALAPGGCATIMFAHAFSEDAIEESIDVLQDWGVDILVDGAYFNGNASATICEGETAEIELADPNLTGISWSPTTGLSTATGAEVYASPASTEIYTYTGTNTITGEAVTGTITVNVLPAPTIDAGADVTIMPGESVVLTATGAVAYSWSPSGGTTAEITVSPPITTTYVVMGVGANGCANYDSVTVFVDQANGLHTNSILPILVYPNPLSTPNALIVSHPDMRGTMEVQIFDGVGKLVYRTQENAEAGKLDFAIPELAGGMYHLLVVGSDGATYRNSLVIE